MDLSSFYLSSSHTKTILCALCVLVHSGREREREREREKTTSLEQMDKGAIVQNKLTCCSLHSYYSPPGQISKSQYWGVMYFVSGRLGIWDLNLGFKLLESSKWILEQNCCVMNETLMYSIAIRHSEKHSRLLHLHTVDKQKINFLFAFTCEGGWILRGWCKRTWHQWEARIDINGRSKVREIKY